jgi:hypothetical protein
MAQKQLKGVSGVLGNIISPEPQEPPSQESAPESQDVPREDAPDQQDEGQASKPEASVKEKPSGPPERNGARRGRPPKARRTSEPVEREKVSLRLRADLAAMYREWSWEERCQFSDLVDRAMEVYLKHREKARKPERE